MADGNGKDGDNVFDFKAFKEALDELKAEQERQKKEQAKQRTKPGHTDFEKMLEAMGTLFKPPSQEEINKATAGVADSLEQIAKAIRATQPAKEKSTDGDSASDDDSGDGEEK